MNSGFPCDSAGKESTCNVGDLGSIPWLGRSPGEGNGYPLQYSDLENSMDCIVHGVTKSWTPLSDFDFHSSSVHLLINLSGCSITLTHDCRARSLCWENQKVHCEVTGTRCLVCELGVPRLCHQGRGCCPRAPRVVWVRRSSHLCRDFWEHFTA